MIKSYLAKDQSQRKRGFSKKKVIVILLTVVMLGLGAWKAYSYFFGLNSISGNKLEMASFDLDVTNDDDSAILPVDFNEVYPGWMGKMEGKVKNSGSVDLLFRMQIENANTDFDSIARTTMYNLEITNQQNESVYSEMGALSGFSEDNESMNINMNPQEVLYYSLVFSLPFDLDDYTTPENDDDTLYQDKSGVFDLAIQSTQSENSSWSSTVEPNLN